MKDYEIAIGLEIHAELNTKSKIFCSCKNEYGAAPNTLTCPVCLGLPGSTPSLNKRAVELAVMTGILLDSNITEHTIFERRNYFYPNLPKGYQITEHSAPICTKGGIKLSSGKYISINRIHLEEDSGRIVSGVDGYSYVDFNRSGVPLVEIVTEPVFASTDEVVEFVDRLRDRLVFADISDCCMEEGGLRFDVNMSIRENKFGELGTRVELKNLSSFKTMAKAIDYETRRQINELESGNLIKKETRVWNEELNRTYSIREKEESRDYRFFPDPDLNVLHITKEDVVNISKQIPESKEVKVDKYITQGLNEQLISIITSEKFVSDYYDRVFDITHDAIESANWISTEVLRYIKGKYSINISSIISEENLACIIKLVKEEKISRNNGKTLLNQVVTSGKSVMTLLKELGMQGIVEDQDIKDIILSEINNNPNIVDEYCCNPESIVNYMLGKIMYATNSKAMPERSKDLIIEILNQK